ncbi:neuralized-like protein 4 [Ixodes scapularis]
MHNNAEPAAHGPPQRAPRFHSLEVPSTPLVASGVCRWVSTNVGICPVLHNGDAGSEVHSLGPSTRWQMAHAQSGVHRSRALDRWRRGAVRSRSGVTALDPCTLAFPSSATNLREGSWVMSGTGVLQDGQPLVEEYGADLDQLGEGDRVGVMRSSAGELQFFVNGRSQGVAARRLPPRVYAVVDLYGKCAQVSIVDGEARSLADNVGSESVVAPYVPSGSSEDPLRFHLRCGALVHLSNGNRTAERRKPADEFNNGVVMTHRALRDDEWFEIRIDELVNKWSGSIELGVTTHNPDTLDFPATMTNMRSGTIMMSGSGILTNGKGSRREYGNYNLDELHEGDRIGVVRKSNGNLHYYINGMDQGMASNSVPQVVYGVVDLYGMTVKVTLLDRSDPSLSLVTSPSDESKAIKDDTNDRETERLLFHPRCGGRALVTNGGRTARRPSALDGFNNAVVLTNRALRADELFEVVLEQQVSKWTGSIDIGVTMFPPHLLEFPTTMTNVRSGTWIMTGCGVMHNGTEVLVDYCRNLDTLQVGDRVGVKRTSDGSLHFFINGADQGVAARNVPARVYGVIDLYGQTAQASVVDHSGSEESGAPPELLSAVPSPSLGEGDQVAAEVRFSELHGRNARVLNNGLTAVRPNAHGEFNFAIVVSSQPLTDNELFEVVVDQMVDRWSGSIEAGVTAIRPEDLEFPSTMTDISHDTWMLSGSAIMRNGNTVRNGYKCDLDQLGVGSRVGMMRDSEGCLRYFVNGEDQGVACRNLPPRVWAVVDLYGQCAQVSIVPQHRIMPALPPPVKVASTASPDAVRASVTPAHSLCTSFAVSFSTKYIRIDELVNKWSGSIELGVTTHNPDTLDFPATMTNMRSGTIMMSGSGILTNGKGSRREYGNYNLDELHEGDRIGVVRKSNGNLHYYINGMDQGMASNSVPQVVYGVVDLYGMTVKVTLLDRSDPSLSLVTSPSDESKAIKDDTNDRETERLLFHPRCGGRALVTNGGRTARRPSALDGFNNAVVLTNRALRADELFEVVLEQQVSKWTGSIDIGVTMFPPHLLEFPTTMTNVRSGTWIMTGCGVMHNGTEVLVDYCRNLDTLQVGDRVGVKRTSDGSLHFFINGADQGVAARNVPARVYGVIDLYGQTAQASVVDHSGSEESGAPPELLSAVPSPSLGEGDQVAAEVRFSELHGRNARVLNNGLTAVRPNAHGEFNFAIVVSSQPLTDNELFEVVVDQMVDRWSGSIEAGESTGKACLDPGCPMLKGPPATPRSIFSFL